MKQAQAEFWSRIANQYDGVVDLQLGPQLRRLVRERLGKEAELGHVLEIGCGTGYFTELLAVRAQSVVATDVAPGMLELAAKAFADRGNLRFQVEDCQKTSFADNTFDTAFMSLVLQFVDADTTLREIGRILKPGGTFLLANLDVFSLRPLLRLALIARTVYYGAVRYGRPMPRVGRDRIFTVDVLRDKLERAGFTVLSSELIEDPSRRSNCPVRYFRAVRRES